MTNETLSMPEHPADAQLPIAIEREVAFPDGRVVFVRVLNELHKTEAQEAANLWAARQTRTYREGEGLLTLQEEFGDMTPDAQVGFLLPCFTRDGTAVADAWDRYPNPERPAQTADEDDETFGTRLDAWDAEVAKAHDNRVKSIEDAQAAERARLETMDSAERLQECVRTYRTQHKRNWFTQRLPAEVLLRAVFANDAFTQRAYPSADAILQIADAERTQLLRAYDALEVSEAAIFI